MLIVSRPGGIPLGVSCRRGGGSLTVMSAGCVVRSLGPETGDGAARVQLRALILKSVAWLHQREPSWRFHVVEAIEVVDPEFRAVDPHVD